MSTLLIEGPRTWSMTRDHEGFREYKVSHTVLCDSTDGPANALTTPGLPIPGSIWEFLNDLDIWVWCRWEATVKPTKGDGGDTAFLVEQTFSNKPLKNCKETQFEDPLLQPQRVSGSFSKYQQEITEDRFGEPTVTSSHEQLSGPKIEFDASRLTVRIEQNVPDLELPLLKEMADTLNDSELWGFPPRTIKFTPGNWEKKFYGQCFYYYTRHLEFEIRKEGWDRNLLDEGTKVLSGEWDEDTGLWSLVPIKGYDLTPNPDKSNPTHFNRFQDRRGNIARVVLDGNGEPFVPELEGITEGCDQCASSPKFWKTSGFSETAALENPGSGCNWTANVNGAIYDLYYGSADNKWYLEITDDVSEEEEAAYAVDAGEWNCLGPNVLTKISGDGPFSLALIDGGKPGKIHVEHYEESNFLFLGIPIDL
jgi:hypothetical protein